MTVPEGGGLVDVVSEDGFAVDVDVDIDVVDVVTSVNEVEDNLEAIEEVGDGSVSVPFVVSRRQFMKPLL